MLAAYYYSLGEHAMARELSAHIITRYKGRKYEAWAVNLLGALYSQQGQYDKAIEKYERAITLNRSFAIAYNNWGIALFSKEDYRGATAKYKKATELKSDFCDAYFNWGTVLYFEGDHAGAKAKYKKANECNPEEYADYLENIGTVQSTSQI